MQKVFFKIGLCLLSVPSFTVSVQAQTGSIFGKVIDATISRQAATAARSQFYREVGIHGFLPQAHLPMSEYSLLFGYGNYNPVLGYKLKNMHEHLPYRSYEMFDSHKGGMLAYVEGGGKLDLQVAPYIQHTATEQEIIVPVGEVTLPQITEGIYLWRLANSALPLRKNGLLVRRAQKLIRKEEYFKNGKSIFPNNIYELPNITFLKRLLNPAFTPKTYGQLAEEITVYPKHITLNANGFPVPTAQAELAQLLDNYLMLSHPKVMGRFNSANMMTPGRAAYTPFVLTPEERMAAEELLAKRHEIAKIPDDATPRQLLEIAYNRLATHNMPYNHPKVAEMNVFFAYPDYKNTKLYRKIKETITDGNTSSLREGTDVSHLIVLDGVMGGVDFQDAAGINRVLDAFEKLCKEVPATAENIAHLQRLQMVLLRTPGFWKFMSDSYVKLHEEAPNLTPWEIMQTQARVREFAAFDIRNWSKF